MATIDIIIPVYNTAKFLDECLESIVNQDFKDWRGVLIDDCSTDGESSAKCDEWASKDSRFEVHHLPSNIGLSRVRNYGLSLIRAPYVTFVDSDDSISPVHLSSLYDALVSGNHDIATSALYDVSFSGKKIIKKQMFPRGKVFYHPDLLRKILMSKFHSHLWIRLYKSSLFDGITFPDRRYFEDHSRFHLLVAKAGSMIHTGKATYYYRKNPRGITANLSPLKVYEFYLAEMDRISFIKSTDILDDFSKKAMLLWAEKSLLLRYKSLMKMTGGDGRYEYMEEIKKTLSEMGVTFKDNRINKMLFRYSMKKRYYEYCFKFRKY